MVTFLLSTLHLRRLHTARPCEQLRQDNPVGTGRRAPLRRNARVGLDIGLDRSHGYNIDPEVQGEKEAYLVVHCDPTLISDLRLRQTVWPSKIDATLCRTVCYLIRHSDTHIETEQYNCDLCSASKATKSHISNIQY